LKTDREYTIEFRKDGYETRTYFLGNKIGAGWIILDVLCGLIPVVVDVATGAWYEFTEENIIVVLEQ
jgi:glycerol-3-phosphate acyltransferase PlsY